MLSHFTNVISLPLVTLANGLKIVAKAVGCTHPISSLPLDFVLYVPNYPFNLMSIRREPQDLYYLNLSSVPITCTVSESLAHNHLGHLSLLKLQKLILGLSNLKSLSCESSQFGKHSHSLFLKHGNKRVASFFELVHFDLWGLCRVFSILGC